MEKVNQENYRESEDLMSSAVWGSPSVEHYEQILRRFIACRRTYDFSAQEESQNRWDGIGKPIDGLGSLEKMISKIAGMTGSAQVDIRKKAVVVMCADNGVVEEGVTQTGQEITALVAENIAGGKSSVCLMARRAGADVFAVDVGIAHGISEERKSESLCPGKIAVKKTAPGTCNIAKQPAMTREQAALIVCRGIETVAELVKDGYRIIATGEMGIGNTTTASAVTCCLTGLAPEVVTGRGAGLSAEGLQRKKEVVRRAVALHHPDPKDALDVLSKIGGFDIAGMTGLFLGGAIYGIPVVVDGVISSASAVLADLLCPGCRDFMLASHMGKEPAAAHLLDLLGLEPVIYARLALGEGTGGVALLPLLDLAMSVYGENITFDDIHMDSYERNQP